MEECPFKSFSTLPQEERRTFLTGLASHFQLSDWWHLNSLLEQQNIHRRFDIVPALPIELAVQVLQYLPLPDLFLNRRVSRCWHNILSSDAICRGLALRRFPTASHEFILSQKPNNHSNIKSWRHLFEDIASRRYLFSKGKYITCPQLDSLITELYETAAPKRPYLRLHEENLTSWDCHLTFWKHHEVFVFNLHDPAQMMRFQIPNREASGHYAIHGEFLTILTTRGKCHTFRMDTGERKTISLESAAYNQLIAVTSTVAIIYSAYIIIWEPNSGKSWRVETSVLKLGVWIYDLDPVGHVISRIYFDPAACAMWQEQFTYGVKEEECYPRSWALKWAPGHSYTPVETANGNHFGLNTILIKQNLRKKVWGRRFVWMGTKGGAMPSPAYDYNRGEWKAREITVPKIPDDLGPGDNYSRAYVLEDATVFLSGRRGIDSVDIYLSDEEKWIKWKKEGWQGTPHSIVEDMSSRHVILVEEDKGTVEVRRFMGIHERKAFEERSRGKVEDTYGTLLKQAGSGKQILGNG